MPQMFQSESLKQGNPPKKSPKRFRAFFGAKKLVHKSMVGPQVGRLGNHMAITNFRTWRPDLWILTLCGIGKNTAKISWGYNPQVNSRRICQLTTSSLRTSTSSKTNSSKATSLRKSKKTHQAAKKTCNNWLPCSSRVTHVSALFGSWLLVLEGQLWHFHAEFQHLENHIRNRWCWMASLNPKVLAAEKALGRPQCEFLQHHSQWTSWPTL